MTEPTVLTLEPLTGNLLGNTVRLQFKGLPCKGREVIKVDYPANFSADSIDKGVEALQHALTAIRGPKLVMGA